MKTQRETSVVVVLYSLLMLFVIAGCSRDGDAQQFGAAIDPQAATVTLAELVAKPEAYEGQNVIVEGQFAGGCGDGDFYFKDKFEIIEADPPAPEVLSLQKGTPIRLYGRVKVRRTGSVDVAEKGEIAEGTDAKKEAEVQVKIAGRGIEVIR